jgi:hypothetical protein
MKKTIFFIASFLYASLAHAAGGYQPWGAREWLGPPVSNISQAPTTGVEAGSVIADTGDDALYLWTGSSWIQLSGGGSSYAFADSLVDTGGTVTLVNDSAAPGDSKYYGTNSSGTLGYFNLPSSGSGTVTNVSVASANGFAGTVSNPTTTPAITMETTVTGILYGNGTGVSAATAGDFPTLNQSTTGNAATATSLAATPTGCSAGEYASSIAANGDLTCSTPTGTTYTFSDSVADTAGNITLVNDSASPGNDQYYGTNGSGTRGYYNLPFSSTQFPVLSSSGVISFADILPANSEDIYVSSAGSDTACPANPCGDGSPTAPYLTITHALASYTDSSSTKPYIVHLGAGTYQTSNIEIPVWTFIVGASQIATKWNDSSNKISINSAAYASGSERLGFQSLTLINSTGFDIDFQSIGGSGSDDFYSNDIQVNGNSTFTGRGSDTSTIYNSRFFGTYTSQCAQEYGWGGYFANSVTFNTTGVTSTDCGPEFVGTAMFSNATFTSSGSGNTMTPTLIDSPVYGTITSDQSTTTLYADDVSLSSGTFSKTNGGLFVPLSVAQYTGYTPATPGNWSPAPAFVNTALDQLAARPALSIGGSNTDVQYNSAGALGGNSGFTYDGSGNATLSGKISSASSNVSGLTASEPVITDGSKNLASGSVSSPLTFSGGAFGCQTASGSQNGCLSSVDWSTFNGKQSSLVFADSLTNSGGIVTLTNDSASPGDSKYYGTNGSGALGYYSLPSPGAGTVTSVALADGSTTPIFTISGSPVTTSGTLTETLTTQSANTALMGPASGSAAQPTFRSLVSADIPNNAANTTGTAANITATSNSTLTTLSSLSLPYSQLSGTIPTWNQNTTGTAANITATSNSTLTSLPNLALPTSQLSGDVSLTSQVSGVLPVANGGTGDSSFSANQVILGGTTSTGALQQVAGATAGEVLTSNGSTSAPTWQSAPLPTTVGIIYNTNGQNINNNQATITYTNQVYDPGSAYSGSGLFTCPSTGYYFVSATWTCNAVNLGVTSFDSIAIYHNGTQFVNNIYTGTGGTDALGRSINALVPCSSGDNIEIVYGTPANETGTSSTANTYLMIYKIGN